MVKKVSQLFGLIFVIIAIMGFVLTGSSMEADVARAPRLLGLFPVNLLHNIVHLAFGLWGLAASRRWGAARTYCRVGGVIYLVLAVVGVVSPSGFGLVPLGGHDVWLHAVLGVALAGAGFMAKDEPVTTGATA